MSIKGKAGDAVQATIGMVGIGAIVGFGIDSAIQEVATLGWGNVMLGAKLGLGGLDWAQSGHAALLGAEAGAVGMAAYGAYRVGKSAVHAISDKLAKRRARPKAQDPSPRAKY